MSRDEREDLRAILNRVEHAWRQALGRSDVVQLEVRDVEAMLNICEQAQRCAP